MKQLLFILFFIPIIASANEEKSLSELIDSENLNSNEILDSSDITVESTELSTDDLQQAEEVELLQEFDNDIVYEDTKNSSEFQGQASSDARKNSCNKSSKENTVCANIMCDFGLLLGEWSSECTDWKKKLILLKAKTPPWKSLPNCVMVDENCNREGRASKKSADKDFCNEIEDLEKRHTCLLALEVDEKDQAADYIVRNGVDETALEQIAFDETESSELANNFLIASVDPRFARDEELFETYTYYDSDDEHESSFVPINYLNYYMENRGDSGRVWHVRNELIKSGIMRSVCADVAFDEFYNCNRFPYLPQQCWSAPNNESIAECVRENRVASIK